MGHERYAAEPPTELDPKLRWFVPGLCYVHAKMPKSLFEVITTGRPELPALTYRAGKPFYVAPNFYMPNSQWPFTVQGLSQGHAMKLLMELTAATFRINGVAWRFIPQSVKLSDPFRPLAMADVVILLPACDDHQLRIVKLLDNTTAVVEKSHGRSP